MTVLKEREQQQQPMSASAHVRFSHATWVLPQIAEHWNGAPRKRGFGARLAVRKFGASLDKLADS
jgi:hypothetical protein